MADLNHLHQALSGVVLVDRDPADVLADLTGIARRAVPGAEATSITLIEGEQAYTAAYVGQLAMDADELQYERGYGPCVDSGLAAQVFFVEDMSVEQRWPGYARHAAAQGVGSSLSVPLPFQSVILGALNVYSTRVGGLTEEAIPLAEEAATFIALAVANARSIARTSDELEGLRTAMVSRATIEQAKGILMERHKLTEDQAFSALTHASQRTNTKLRTVAEQLVRTGVLAGSDVLPT